MAVVTDKRILERIAAIVLNAKPVERPIIPQRVAPPARGSARRKIPSTRRPKGAAPGEASPGASGEAGEAMPDSGGAGEQRDGRKGAERDATARRNAGGAVGKATDQAELDARLAFFPLTDLGNAERFRERNRGRLIWCAAIGWMWWDGRRWNRDGANEKVSHAVHLTVRSIQDEARAIKGTPKDKVVGAKGRGDGAEQVFYSDQLEAWGRTSEAHTRLTPIAKQATTYLAVAPAQLDADPMMVNVENGTLAIDSNAPGYVCFRPHDSADLITKLAPVRYDPNASCPTYDDFLAFVQPKDDVRVFCINGAGFR